MTNSIFGIKDLHVGDHTDRIVLVDETRTPNRFIWQRSGEDIYHAKEIIFTYYYNGNETETVLADQLKKVSIDYYPFSD